MKYSLQEIAIQMNNIGLNVYKIGSKTNIFNHLDSNILKAPNHAWLQYKDEPQSKEFLQNLDWNEDDCGIGLILGFRNTYAIDIDGCNDIKIVNDILKILELPINYKWVIKSGSNNGFHVVFRCLNKVEIHSSNDLEKTENDLPFGFGDTNAYYPDERERYFDKIEFKWSGNLVLPNSLHVTGNDYEFVNGLPIELPELIEFYKILSVKRKFGSLQSKASDDPYSTRCILRLNVAFGDENEYNFIKRKKEPIIVVHNVNYRIIGDSFPSNYFEKHIVQLSWFVIDKKHNVIKRKILNYFSSTSPEISFAGQIDYSKVQHIVSENKKALLEMMDDMQHCQSLVTSDELSFNELLKNIEEAGLYFDKYGKGPFKLFFELNENDSDGKIQYLATKPSSFLSISDLYSEYLSFKHQRRSFIFGITESEIIEMHNRSKDVILNNDNVIKKNLEMEGKERVYKDFYESIVNMQERLYESNYGRSSSCGACGESPCMCSDREKTSTTYDQ